MKVGVKTEHFGKVTCTCLKSIGSVTLIAEKQEEAYLLNRWLNSNFAILISRRTPFVIEKHDPASWGGFKKYPEDIDIYIRRKMINE